MQKVGVFLDLENLKYCGGRDMNLAAIEQILEAYGYTMVRGTAYLAYDPKAEAANEVVRTRNRAFRENLKRLGFTPYLKTVRRYDDGASKANADVDLAVDAVTQSRDYDAVLIGSGDGDFQRLVEILQFQGKKVFVLSLLGTCPTLVEACDIHIPGLLFPSLIPTPHDENHAYPEDWVRGVVQRFNPVKGYGFIEYPQSLNNKQFETLFFHITNVDVEPEERNQLCQDMHRDQTVVEFQIRKSPRQEHDFHAVNVRPFFPPKTKAMNSRYIRVLTKANPGERQDDAD